MTPKKIEDCRTGKELLTYIDKLPGAHIRNGKGSHFIVSTDKGSVAVPYHGHKDLGIGLQHKIYRALTLIGIAVLVLMMIHIF